MEVVYYKEYSECLLRDMEMKVYGTQGQPFIVFPAQNGRYFDFENFGMVESVKDKIEQGQIQLFCVDSIDEETYSDETGDPSHRS